MIYLDNLSVQASDDGADSPHLGTYSGAIWEHRLRMRASMLRHEATTGRDAALALEHSSAGAPAGSDSCRRAGPSDD